MTFHAPAHRSGWFAGLDGLRAIAVALVVVYHLFPQGALPGGFVGVDVFFVISGFLITSLLLREHDATGRIALRRFWQRRARRLLPAMAVVVTVCSTLAWMVGGDVLTRLGVQVLGAATFSYNWVSVAGDGGYFGSATPELFRNFWSLAVEEQFYVLWPLILPLFLLLPRAWGRVTAALLLAAASVMWMGIVVSQSTGDVTRAYFGTDTHAFGILLGVATAFALTPLLRSDAAWRRRTPVLALTGVVGIVGVAGIVLVALAPPAGGLATFPGALLLASVCSVAVIVAGVWPSSWLGPRLDAAPLRWVGNRSYGIYLWHWPLLVLAVAANGGSPIEDVPLWISVSVLVATLLVATASYRFIEMPIRRLGFRGALGALGAAFARNPQGRLRAGAASLTVVLALGGTTAAIAAAPQETSAESYVQAGLDALESGARGGADGGADGGAEPDSTAGAQPGPDAGTSDDTADEAGTAGSGETPTPTASAGELVPEPAPSTSSSGSAPGEPESSSDSSADTETAATPEEPAAIDGRHITAVGDSVMLASAGALLDRFPGIQVDAAVSRSAWAGPGILDDLASRDKLRHYVVVALGTNGPVDHGSLEQIADIAGPDREVILVNAYAPRDWIAGVNKDLKKFAAGRHGVTVANWAGAIRKHTNLLAGDKIHPGDAGGRIFADTIASTIERIDAANAAQHDRNIALYLRLAGKSDQ